MSVSDFIPLPLPPTSGVSDNPIHVSGTAPANPARGWGWMDTSSTPPVLKVFNGSVWVAVGGTGLPAATRQGQVLQAAASPFPWVASEFIDEGRF